MTTAFDILIVGAGMVGSALACTLADSGARIGLIERELTPDFDPHAAPDLRVSAINFASQRLLADLGAWSEVIAMRACPYRQLAVWEKLDHPLRGGEITARFNRTCFSAEQVGQPQLGHIIENKVLQLALQKRVRQFPNIELIAPAQIRQAELFATPPQLQLDDGRCLTAPLIVGADGAFSRVRQWAGIGEFADAYAQTALVATVEIEGPQQDITWQAFTPTGPLAFLPLADVDGRSYASLVWYHPSSRTQELLALPEADFLAAVARTFPKELPPIKGLVGRSSFPLVKRHALNYVKAGVALVGDAAHTINPLAGQGLNLGFKDVVSLGKVLAQARRAGESWGSLDVLQRYEQERRPANQLMMSLMDLFYHGFSSGAAPLKLIRNLGLTAAALAKPAQRPVIAYAMGLQEPPPLPPLPAFLRDRLAGLSRLTG